MENKQKLIGNLRGVLPISREFEFFVPDGYVIHGKVDEALGDIRNLYADWARKTVEITLSTDNGHYIMTAISFPVSVAEHEPPV